MSRADTTARRRNPAGKGRGAAKAVTPETLPAWLPLVVYALVTVLMFREFFFTGAPLLGLDTFALSYFAREFYTQFVTTVHRFPLWDPLLFGGLPFVDGMHGDIFYPPSLALFFLDARTMWGWKMVLHVFLAGVLAYVWLRRGPGVRRAPAFFGGLVFMMGADLVSLVYPGGDGKLFVSALAPLLFLLTHRAAVRGRISDYAFFALGLALVVFTSHMQLAYFTVWGVSLYFFYRLWVARREGAGTGLLATRVGLFALAGLLGVGAAAVQFFPPLGYLRQWSQRVNKTVQAGAEGGYEYSTSYSLHPEEAVSLVVPEFIGDNAATEVRSGATYWGRNPLKYNHEYAGFVPLLLIPLLFVRRRDPDTWFFSGLAVASIVYALGATTPLFQLFYLVPGVNLFRAPSLIIFLYGLSVATLGAMGLQRLLDETGGPASDRAATRKMLWSIAGVFLVLALAQSGGLITSVWQSVSEVGPSRAASLEENLANIRVGFWITFALALAVAGAWELVTAGALSRRDAVIAFAVLAALDLYRVDRPFIRATALYGRAVDAQAPALFVPDETIDFLKGRVAAGEVFRAFDLGALFGSPVYLHQNTLAAHGIEQVAGHHGNEMAIYDALIGGETVANAPKSNLRLLDLVNAEYLVSPQPVQVPWYEEVFRGQRSIVYRNNNVVPRAFLVGETEVVNDADAVTRMLGPDFEPRRTALLPAAAPADLEIRADPEGTVTWAERGVNAYELRVTTDRPALLMVLDNYYPAWHASVDGAEAPLLRADYAFRAVPVPAGDHAVRFEYRSDKLRSSAAISVGLILLLLAVGLGGEVLARRKRREPA